MPEEPFNLVLEHLRAIRGDLAVQSGLIRDLGERMTRVEVGLSHLRRDQALDAESVAHMGVRIDRLQSDVDRIKTRLDLREA